MTKDGRKEYFQQADNALSGSVKMMPDEERMAMLENADMTVVVEADDEVQ